MANDTLTLGSAHNFGIYMKGRRTIFQIDFTCKTIHLIERGNIKKKYGFENLEQYDSEDDLHIVLKFRGSKDLEFDADTAEEKYTICRLLGLVQEDLSDQNDQSVLTDQNGLRPKLATKKQIIKEGVVEKKGNTKIPTWAKRQLQVCPGEFSYYKPGEEIALNLVQLWENSVSISKHGSNGFIVAVRDRNYFFRVVTDKVNPYPEATRDGWIQALQQAKQRKRATFLLLEMSSQNTDVPSHRIGMPLPGIPGEEEEVNEYYNQYPLGDTGGQDSTEEIQDPGASQALQELDKAISGDFTQAVENRQPPSANRFTLSAVPKTEQLTPLTKNRTKKPPSKESFKGSSEEQANNVYELPPDYTPPGSPTRNEKPGYPALSEVSRLDLQEARPSGKYTTVIKSKQARDELEAKENGFGIRESGQYNDVIKQAGSRSHEGQMSSQGSSQSEEEPTDNSPRQKIAGAVELPKFNLGEQPKLRKVGSVTKQDSPKTSPRAHSGMPESVSVKEALNIYANDNRQEMKPKSPAPATPLSAAKTPPTISLPPPPNIPAPPPPVQSPPPPPPPPSAPPPPPLCQDQQQGRPRARGKMKQVHWNRVPKPLVNESIWRNVADVTPRLNFQLLEEHFSLQEREVQTPGVQKNSGKQLLIDGKRAQNLGIFMSGLKSEGTRKLIDVLNSVVEDETFPAEKLTTIRRYQPTQDEIDMYREYINKQHELHPVDQFMLELCQIPCLNIRIDICLIIWDFPWQYESACQLVDQVHSACDELQSSQKLIYVLEYMLAIGNYMNKSWSENTQGFQLSSLDTMLSMRGREPGYTMVHFLVEQLKVTDPGLLNWPEDLKVLKKCEQCSVRAVVAESEVLKADLSKVKRHLKTLKQKMPRTTRQDMKFQQDAMNLTSEYELKLEKLDRRCMELQNKYRRLMARFGEPMYQRSDDLFAVVAKFIDKFKAAMKDFGEKANRKSSTS